MADATITFNTSIDQHGFESGVDNLGKKTDGLKEAITRLGMTMDSAFKPDSAEQTTAAIMKQQGVVVELQRKLNDIATIEARTPLIAELKAEIQVATQFAKELEGAIADVGKQESAVAGIEEKLRAIADRKEKVAMLEQMKIELNIVNEESKKWREEINDLEQDLERISDLGLSNVDLSYITDPLKEARLNAAQMEKEHERLTIAIKTLELPKQPKEAVEDLEKSLEQANARLIETKESLEKFGGVEALSDAKQYTQELKDRLADVSMPTQPKESAEELAQKLVVANKKLDEMKEKGKQSTNQLTSGMSQVSNSVEKTANRIKGLVVGAFVFNVLRKAIKEFRDYVFAAAMENEAFARSFNQFKANMYAAIQPLLNALIPALTKVADVFAYISGIILQIVATITNQNVQSLYAQAKARDKDTREKQAAYQKQQAEAQKRQADAEKKAMEDYQKELARREKAVANEEERRAKALDKQDKAYQNALDKMKKQQKEIQKSTAAFDELITLASGTEDEVDILPDMEEMKFDDLQFEELTMAIQDAIIEGFNGGVEQGIYDNLAEPKELTQKIKDLIGEIMVISAIVMITLGIILLFTGNIPIGLGLIVAGALLLWTAIEPLWGGLSEKVKETIMTILVLTGIVLLALGCILALTGAGIAIGIAMIAAGALLLYVAAKKSDDLSSEVREKIAKMLTLVGITLIVIGVLLLVTGVGIGFGIALIVAGIGAIVAAAKMDKDAVLDTVKKAFEVIKTIAMGGLIVLGIILCVTGMVPLGIALLAYAIPKFIEGLQGLGVDTNSFTDKIQEVLDKIKSMFSTWWESIKHGTAMIWWGIKSGAINMANFVIDVLNGMIAGVLAPFNAIIDGLNLIPGTSIPRLSWSIPKIQLPAMPQMPALAAGAVLPGGAPFMAWVNDQPRGQTNIEAPLSVIEEALENVFSRHAEELGDAPVVARIDGNMAGFFRYLNIELQREQTRASAFA